MTSLGSRHKAPGPQSPSEDAAQGAQRAVRLGDSRRVQGHPLAAPPPEEGDTRRHHAPERGPPWPCALGLPALGGHRLQPASDHHQGRCSPFFCCKSGDPVERRVAMEPWCAGYPSAWDSQAAGGAAAAWQSEVWRMQSSGEN